MLPRKNRLVQRKDFERVWKTGNFFSLGKIGLKIAKNEQIETRVGFSVGLKFSKKAVARNRIKRQLREIMRGNLFRLKKGFDIIITVKNSSRDEMSSRELAPMITEALQKANLIK